MSCFEYDLFLSHNRADKDWAKYLAQKIQSNRSRPPLKVFIDEWYIEPGENIVLALENALKTSKRVGLVLSKAAVLSDWVSAERTVGFFRDPSGRNRTIIPLLKEDCEIPELLRPIEYIDFRNQSLFDESLKRLISVLRGQKYNNDGKLTADKINLREDCQRIRLYRIIFERPAYSTPCVHELSVNELSSAIKHTLAAINTGTLYSRDNVVLRTLPSKSEFSTKIFKDALTRIATHLSELRNLLHLFERFGSQDFYSIMLSHSGNVHYVLHRMDQIDSVRIKILQEANSLLKIAGESLFPLIEMSSYIMKRSKNPRNIKLMNPNLSIEERNLLDWKNSYPAWQWINEHHGQWNHEDWLKLLESLKTSGNWPMQPDTLGQALEELRDKWKQNRY